MSQAHNGHVRVGTRGSALARWQAEWVASELRRHGAEPELILITTGGDADQRPLGSIGGQGLFTKEIQRALLDEAIDIAVHSLKDLPTDPIAGLTLGAVPQRESPFDALITNQWMSLAELPPESRVGTGSLRRQTQLLHQRPDLKVLDIRGNVDTRLRKLDDSEFDAIILAEAGLRRLELAGRISCVLPSTIMMPAVGQGALGIECRAEDQRIRDILQPLNDLDTHRCVQAERALLATLQGGCSAPVGANCQVREGQLHLQAVVLGLGGKQRLTGESAGPDPQTVADAVSDHLLAQGAGDLIDESRRE